MESWKWAVISILILILILIIAGFVIFKTYNQIFHANKEIVTNSSFPFYNTHNVDITNVGFIPATIEINAGDIIIWKNTDFALHRVVSQIGDKFDSGKLYKGQNYTKIFYKEETIDYYCPYHSYTKGKIVVKNGDKF